MDRAIEHAVCVLDVSLCYAAASLYHDYRYLYQLDKLTLCVPFYYTAIDALMAGCDT